MYEPCSAEDLADKLEKVSKDEVLRVDIAESGKRFLREKCCEPIMAEEIEEFFKHIAGG